MKKNYLFGAGFYTIMSVFAICHQVQAQYNYGEALQKSIFFYECQRSGDIPSNNRVSWRDDSGMKDGQDNSVDLTGGWYDAGDHVKFNFPMAYTATMLALGAIEYKDVLQSTGQWQYMLDNIRWVNDYFIKCHTAPNEFYGQVGDGGLDHSWWGAAEVMQMNRPSYKLTTAKPGTDLVCETAAAMAAASIVFKTIDPAYSSSLLTHAIQLYSFGETYLKKYHLSILAAQAYYQSWSGYEEELVWGALWIYLANNDNAYLTKAKNYFTNIENEQQSAYKPYKWTHCWDDKSFGSYVLLARITGDSLYKKCAENWLDYWTVGFNGSKVNTSPGGVPVIQNWGVLRYSSSTAFWALVYSDYLKSIGGSSTLISRYHDFGVKQINYILGSNPQNRSYLIGFGNNPPQNPHHRTAHGSWANTMETPTQTRHIIYGALVGGPDINDNFTDIRSKYECTEVALDYNAAFVGALARMQKEYGGAPLSNFPLAETKDEEFYTQSKVNSSGNRYIEISTNIYNHTAWPAKVTDHLSFRYFVDLTEVFNLGYTLNDITVTTAYSQGSGVSKLTKCACSLNPNVYYIEVFFEGVKIYPGGQSESKREAQYRLSLPTNNNNPDWSNANDWSFADVGTSTHQTSRKVPIYNSGILIWGDEPCPVNSSDQIQIHNDFSVFPNPASDQVNILLDVNQSEDVMIAMYDMNGKRVSVLVNQFLSGGQHRYGFDVSAYKAGFYMLKMQSASMNKTIKLVLTK